MLNGLTSAEAAELYGIPVEQFLVWWMRGEVPFKRVVAHGQTYFVLNDPARDGGAPPAHPPGATTRERLNEVLRSLRPQTPLD